MKIISTVYQHVHLKGLDDWLGWKKEKESGLTCPDREAHMEEEKQWYTQEQIRQLNADFNYENYEQIYEKLDEEEGEDGSGGEDDHVSESEASSIEDSEKLHNASLPRAGKRRHHVTKPAVQLSGPLFPVVPLSQVSGNHHPLGNGHSFLPG